MEGGGRARAIGFKSEEINLVTEFDKRSEALIVERLAAAFPDDRVVAEEGTTRGTEPRRPQRVWYVDPLDGTTNFAHGMPLFSVSLGLAIDRRPVLGVVEAPALGWSFAGTTTGGGSTFNGKPIAPSAIDRLLGALLVTGFPYTRNPVHDNMAEFAALTAAAQGTRRLGSAALDLCFVACGWLDGYWERELHPWDLVGGSAIVIGAGGQATDLDGRPFDGETGRVLATNGRIHGEMRAHPGGRRAPREHAVAVSRAVPAASANRDAVKVAGAIIAGGPAKRLGGVAKPFLKVGGRAIAERQLDLFRAAALARVFVVANDPAPWAPLGIAVVPDLVGGMGPLGGVHAALTAADDCDAVICLAGICRSSRRPCSRRCATARPGPTRSRRVRRAGSSRCAPVTRGRCCPVVDARVRAGELAIHELLEQGGVDWIATASWPRWIRMAAASST